MTDSIDTILIVDDEAPIRLVLRAHLRGLGYNTIEAPTPTAAINLLSKHNVAVILTDLRMPHGGGMRLLEDVMSTRPQSPVIFLTAHGSINRAVEAMKLGAYDFLSKPFDSDSLGQVVSAGISEYRRRSLQLYESQEGRFKLIGKTDSMKRVYQIIEKVSNTNACVLIQGESGTGKELVARALHDNSNRSSNAFVQINCGAIPETLFESEFFGHERGSFTGAHQRKPGKFELASNGTLFLDEVGELPRSLQVKLLRALQDQQITSVGGLRPTSVDARLIAATNRDLRLEVENGNFREDLFYRLNVVPICLPPLRDRREDIPMLVMHFFNKAKSNFSREDLIELNDDELQHLIAYDWPGNIRELENVIERAVLLSPPDHFELEGFDRSMPENVLDLKEYIREQVRRLEAERISIMLKACDGNITHTAERLGISRKSLQNKMRDYQLRDRIH